MAFVEAKCTNCGANIQVDESKDAGICPFCGTAFVTEKVIRQSIVNNNTVTNIQSQQNIFYGGSDFQTEKKQCKVLLMLLNNMDLQYLKERALKVLDLNPDNSLAQMIYDCNFEAVNYEGFSFLELRETPLLTYLEKENGKIDEETSITFIKALVLEAQTDNRVQEIVRLIFENVAKLGLPDDKLYAVLEQMAEFIGDVSKINTILHSSTMSKLSGVINLFTDSSSASSDFIDAASAKRLANIVLESRRKIALVFSEEIRKTNFTQEKKNKLYSKMVSVLGDKIQSFESVQAEKNTPGNDGNISKSDANLVESKEEPLQQQEAEKKAKKGVGIFFAVLCIALVLIAIVVASNS